VAGEVVEDHDITLLQRGCELGLDPGFEDLAVYRPVDQPGRGEAIAAQAGDKDLRAPVAEGGASLQP
jgi:hypothetical protein